jgi:hypothetical protein
VTVFRTFFDESAAYLLIRATAARRDQQMQADAPARSKNRWRAERGFIHGAFSDGKAIVGGAFGIRYRDCVDYRVTSAACEASADHKANDR